MRKLLLLSNLYFLSICAVGQGPYAPAAGQVGSTAMHKDSSAFVAWATLCDLKLGYVDITNKLLGTVNTGNNLSALGIADGAVVSLGDSGIATIYFQNTIYDGPGPDFAVFENSFSNTFLEMAKVWVSSDDENYYEFPSHSLTPDTADIGGFGNIDPTDVNNLAGKYRAQYGTPFDLSELTGFPGLDVNNISSLRLIDVVGSSDSQFATLDSAGNRIIDPFTTPFASSGFDLDAVGVIYSNATTHVTEITESTIKLYPNPCVNYFTVELKNNGLLEIWTMNGRLLKSQSIESGQNIVITDHLKPGVYLSVLKTANSIQKGTFVKW